MITGTESVNQIIKDAKRINEEDFQMIYGKVVEEHEIGVANMFTEMDNALGNLKQKLGPEKLAKLSQINWFQKLLYRNQIEKIMGKVEYSEKLVVYIDLLLNTGDFGEFTKNVTDLSNKIDEEQRIGLSLLKKRKLSAGKKVKLSSKKRMGGKKSKFNKSMKSKMRKNSTYLAMVYA